MGDRSCNVRQVGRVVVPVTDQDRALEFYTGVLGFEVRTDAGEDGGGGRWLEVAPAGAATTIAIVPPRGGMWGTVGEDTRISLDTQDIDSDHAAMLAHGADVDPVMRIGGPVPPFFFFRDPDGNTLQVVQAD